MALGSKQVSSALQSAMRPSRGGCHETRVPFRLWPREIATCGAPVSIYLVRFIELVPVRVILLSFCFACVDMIRRRCVGVFVCLMSVYSCNVNKTNTKWKKSRKYVNLNFLF